MNLPSITLLDLGVTTSTRTLTLFHELKRVEIIGKVQESWESIVEPFITIEWNTTLGLEVRTTQTREPSVWEKFSPSNMYRKVSMSPGFLMVVRRFIYCILNVCIRIGITDIRRDGRGLLVPTNGDGSTLG